MLFRILGAGSATVVFLCVVIAAVVTTVIVAEQPALVPGPTAGTGAGSTPSPQAREDIPAAMLVLYQQAAADCPGLDWSVLAGIGKVESDHDRSTLPGVHNGENSAGAAGPMQFLAPTFDAVATRHQLPGASPPSRYDPVDAVHAAAYNLCDSGAPADLRTALFAYNHSDTYVDQVLDQAAAYRAPAPPAGTGDCRPAGPASPAAVQAISFACAQLGVPYVWGGNGPEVNGGWDCSGLVLAAYATAGITLPRTSETQVLVGPRIPENQMQPGDLVFYRSGGDVHHVGLYLGGGLMVHAPDFGQVVQVSGYRWTGDDFYTATRPSAITPTAPADPHA
ncbi:C40 family peptidase [Nocardia aurantiaca]|uniref:Transglycosylase SLT domain-containing protein n=1 Tax=Nocardia aurantiaca TaxID=2675850 RepID=A0A6I3LB03_9NOCA|nr:C40 family peptidase [Nocardia aurantiaca]MTE17039.1 transglycosylase SLT domain-containing protein [Nocardia aurantiaca]